MKFVSKEQMQALDALARQKEWFRFVEDGGFSVRIVVSPQAARFNAMKSCSL